jgi:predicted metal-dependent peptidase
MVGKVRFEDGTEAPWVEEVGQRAADYIINDMLVESKIGTINGKPPADACWDNTLITHKDNFVTAYQKLYKKSNGGKGMGGKGGFDVVLKPGTGEGKSATQAKDERNDQEWKTAVAAAMASAKAQGKLSGSMSSMFEEVLEPQVAWQDYIMGFFQRKSGSGSFNFRRPDKRFIVRNPRMFIPARSGHGADVVVVAIDTSGSIGDKTVAMFLGEVAGVLEEVRPASLYVMWCDSKVQRVDQPDDIDDLHAMRRKGAPGRGGTSFVPVFNRVQKMGLKPDALIYLTDMMGDFPKVAPSYPVLWGSIGTDKAPFGEVVVIPNADKA